MCEYTACPKSPSFSGGKIFRISPISWLSYQDSHEPPDLDTTDLAIQKDTLSLVYNEIMSAMYNFIKKKVSLKLELSKDGKVFSPGKEKLFGYPVYLFHNSARTVLRNNLLSSKLSLSL